MIEVEKDISMYQYDQRPNTMFDEASAQLLQKIKSEEYAVFVGPNNCGKSFILKTLAQQIGKNASYIGPARYQNFHLLGYYTPNRNKKNEKWQQFMHQWQNQNQNIDNSPLNLQQAIAELSDERRNLLREIVKLLLESDLEILHTVPENSMSQKYISCSGHNISFTSSGFRLITALFTSLLDTDYDTFLIDEPELGISPEAQGIIADFLFDHMYRTKYFSHVKTLVFATHSTIFLDRRCITNNYSVLKNGDVISIEQIKSQLGMNNIHFFLLGNRFETLYLPSIILLVEGKCDHQFIQKVVSIKYPEYQLSAICTNSDSRIKEVLNIAKNLLTDLQKSPYRNRIIAVLDSVHTSGLKQSLVEMGLPEENVVIWPKNGIEFYYPPEVLNAIFGNGQEIEIKNDRITRNGLSYSKAELCGKVVERITTTTLMNPEFESLLLGLVRKRLGLTTESTRM